MKLAEWIKDRRMTQQEFSEAISEPPSNVSRWVLGRVRPRWAPLKKIKEFTGGEVTADDFLADAESGIDESVSAPRGV